MHSPYKLYGFYVGGRKLVNVDVDNDLYEEIKQIIGKRKYDYSSVKFFVQRAIYNEIQRSKGADSDFEKTFAKVKEILKHHPELKARLDEIYNSEIKKIKKGVMQ